MTKKDLKKELVDSPSHYNIGGVECIDAIEACLSTEAFKGFLKGNILKYIWRYEYKSKPAEDIAKADWYLQRLKKAVKNEID